MKDQYFFCVASLILSGNYWASTGGNMKLVADIARKVNFSIVDDLRALLKTSKSESARRLSGHKTGKKPRERSVFLFSFSSRKGKLPFFCLENPQAFSNSRFLEVPLTTPVPETLLESYDISQMTGSGTNSELLKSLLFQSGHLTIRTWEGDGQILSLDFPNAEVREAFSLRLISAYIGDAAEQMLSPYCLLSKFESGDISTAIGIMRSVHFGIPYEISIGLKERVYHMAFYSRGFFKTDFKTMRSLF